MKKIGLIIGLVLLFQVVWVGAFHADDSDEILSSYSTDEYDMVIITPNKFYDAIQPLNNKFFSNSINCQGGPQEEWNKTYGGENDDFFYDGLKTKDNGYIICGDTRSFNDESNNNQDGWLMKIDAYGNEICNETYGGSDSDNLVRIHPTLDDGYILSGWTNSYSNADDNDIWIIKTDENGNEVWNKTYGGRNEEFCMSHIIDTNDGGYIFSGYSGSNRFNWGDVWVVKIDSQGNQEWNKTYGGNNLDFGIDITMTNDDGYLILGNTNSYGAGNRDCWIIKINDDGVEEWNTTVGNTFYNWAEEIIQTEDNGFIITGVSEYVIEADYDYFYLDYDVWVFKINNQGHLIWETTIGDRYYDEIAHTIYNTSDNGYIISGFRQSQSSNKIDAYIVKIDTNGHIEWKKIFGQSNNQVISRTLPLNNDGYLCFGYTLGDDTDDFDGWIIKLSSFENKCPLKPSKPIGNLQSRIFSTCEYSSTSIDPEDQQIFYLFSWEDGYDSGWLGPYNSGENGTASYFWTEPGNYEIKVKVKDIHGGESEWSDPLAIHMPRNVIIKNWLFLRLFKQMNFSDFYSFLSDKMEVWK